MGSNLLAVLHRLDLSLLFVVMALLCFAFAAYAAWLRNVVAAVLLVFVGVVLLIV
jgi:hypothetical protein